MASYRTVFLFVIFSFIALSVHPAFAQKSREPSACYTSGFSDFSEIVIYFTEDSNGMSNRLSPDIFSEKNIADLIEVSIKKSFAPCLKDEKSGKEKAITVLSSSIEQRDFFYKHSYKLNDKNNLIIAVKKTYVSPEQDMSKLGGYGLVAYDIYRPGNESAHLESKTSKIGVFFNEGNASIQSQLEHFFESFGPLMFQGNAPWGDHLQRQ